jgi:hypothetical protein
VLAINTQQIIKSILESKRQILTKYRNLTQKSKYEDIRSAAPGQFHTIPTIS